MIPVKLALRNFMPYRDNVPPLYFNGIHTVSICGDNGNGKSALIDAITWALWGQARSKTDDELIHSNQTEMEVEFDFAVGQQTYRVIRKHAKPRRRQASGQTILEFQVASEDGFRSITGNTKTQTQQKIIDILHMDYETFINSAYLRQGHADEFTVSNPAKRKQVLADILGLSFYDQLEEQAREQVKQRETEKTQLESAIKDIDGELAQKPAYEAELKQAGSALANIEKVISEQEARLNELRQRHELLKNRQQQLAQLEEHTAETARTLEHWQNQIKQHHSRIKEYEELIAGRARIEEGYTQFIEARKLIEELNRKLTLVNRLNQRQYELNMAIERAQSALVTEHKLAESKISELETKSQKLPQLKDKLQQAKAELNQLAGAETVLNQKRQAGQELRNHFHHQEADKTRLSQEITQITEKLSLLSTQTEAKCPLCGKELGTEGLKHIEDEYTAQKQQKTDSLKSNQSELVKKEAELKSIETEVSRLETKLNQDKVAAQSQASLLSQQIDEAEKTTSQLNEARSRLVEIEERLAKKEFATSEQTTLHQLESELARLDYDAQQHEQVRQQLTDLEQYESPKRRLEEADRLIDQERETLSRAEQAAQELRHSLEIDNQKGQELTAELGVLPQLSNELARAETERQKSNAQQKQAQETVGSVKGKLQRCAELETRKVEKAKLRDEAAREEDIYRELAQAFGKKGIQALLIEMALPEIEAGANRLLGRMTDNRMHIKIETQRETKKGDAIETLDINIADELGTRNYEMFSGGEAFRINFAIRIALSELLARRHGAALRTLIIDEGFGTQDSAGLEKIKEAITSIQDDFDKIIVITHVEELRDAFPTRIDVIKTAQGSTFEVS
ncbi:MAG: SMC family ATPase [Chloroflexi bacterium]|nr:SMC family ATPase [Chloroflexota bacterium]